MEFPFEYRRLGAFTWHVLSEPRLIKAFVLTWIMREWEIDHAAAPDEEWTVEWMQVLPRMEFALEIIPLEDIRPRAELMRIDKFRAELAARADERQEAMLRGVSIEPLLVDSTGMELMDGYTRHTVLRRQAQAAVYAYIGTTT